MHVRHCGINSIHEKEFKIELPHGFGDYLFLRMKTPTRFYIEGERYDAAENDIMLYRKGDPQYYEALDVMPHVDDFLFFDTDSKEDAAFMEQLPLKYNQLLRFSYIQPIMNVHQMIYEEYISQNERRRESIHSLLQYFLIKLSESMDSELSGGSSEMYERFHELRRELYRFPACKWTVDMMADRLNVSPSYFQSIYKKLFHISCMADLFNSRMNYARQLLTTTSFQVNEIAVMCGYESNI